MDFCGISVLQFVSHHPAVMGFDFIVIVPLLLSQCGFSFVFGCGVSFLVSSSVSLSITVQQSVVIQVFSLWLLLCVWMWGIFFSEFQCPPVSDCSAVSCDSGVLTRGSEPRCSYFFKDTFTFTI